jgi:very-short-patch-repair endonuclease
MNEYNHFFGMHAGAKPELFRFAEKLREQMTEPEKKLWEYLRKKPLRYKFRRQHPFSLYILDFYCHKAKLAIEIDGEYHDYKEQKDLDNKRTNEISRLGVFELRFTNNEVLNNFEVVVRSIESYIRQNRGGQATL